MIRGGATATRGVWTRFVRSIKWHQSSARQRHNSSKVLEIVSPHRTASSDLALVSRKPVVSSDRYGVVHFVIPAPWRSGFNDLGHVLQ